MIFEKQEFQLSFTKLAHVVSIFPVYPKYKVISPGSMLIIPTSPTLTHCLPLSSLLRYRAKLSRVYHRSLGNIPQKYLIIYIIVYIKSYFYCEATPNINISFGLGLQSNIGDSQSLHRGSQIRLRGFSGFS